MVGCSSIRAKTTAEHGAACKPVEVLKKRKDIITEKRRGVNKSLQLQIIIFSLQQLSLLIPK